MSVRQAVGLLRWGRPGRPGRRGGSAPMRWSASVREVLADQEFHGLWQLEQVARPLIEPWRAARAVRLRRGLTDAELEWTWRAAPAAFLAFGRRVVVLRLLKELGTERRRGPAGWEYRRRGGSPERDRHSPPGDLP